MTKTDYTEFKILIRFSA